MGLPYLLGDRDPRDPVNGWDRTWAYLEDLDGYVDYYPGRTGQSMTELGQRALIATTMGWDINQRALGAVPKQAAVQALSGEHWIGTRTTWPCRTASTPTAWPWSSTSSGSCSSPGRRR
jgi:putative spermidine/putrescine transport system substrate-binding protein